MGGGGILTQANGRHTGACWQQRRTETTRPTLPSHHHPPDPTTIWGCEISSVSHENIVEREANPEARRTPSKEGGLVYQPSCLTRNQI